MNPCLQVVALAFLAFGACSADSAARRAPSRVTLAAADDRCHGDADCVFNPVDCSECGPCPDSQPTAVLATQIPMLREECARNPPVRLNPHAASMGLTPPNCAPCNQPEDPRPIWRPVCLDGACQVLQVGVEERKPPTDSLALPGTERLQPGPSADVRADKTEVPWLSLGVTAPFSHASITLDFQGNLDYRVMAHTPVEQEARNESKSVRISREQVEALKKLIDDCGIFSQQGKWDIRGEDCISYGLEVKSSAGEKSFGCHCGCPDEFARIVTRLEELLGQPILIEGF